MQLPIFLVATATVAPGIHAWWTGRTLIARTSDPAFPEMLLARRQRVIQVAAVAISLLAVFATEHAAWTIPVLIVAALVGGFSFRRTLYGETWSLGDYLPYVVASTVGGAGFWIMLAFAPGLIVALINSWAPAHVLPTAMTLGVVFGAALLWWEHAFPRVWLAAHRATPLERVDLASRFDAIIARAGVRRPGIFRYGAAGSYSMNAFALPSTTAPRVALGDTLLEMLTPDEIAAIFAHEVAHLEHFDTKVLRRLWIMTKVMLVGTIALPALLYSFVPEHTAMIALVWPFVVLGILVWRFSRSQAHETDSDVRGAELTGDTESMISALTKLHHYSRLPRRWPYDFERTASHPSLARRIQALRNGSTVATTSAPAAAGDVGRTSPVGSTPPPIVLRSTVRGELVVLDATRGYWFEGVSEAALADGAPTLERLREQAASYRAVAYVDLAELRVAITAAGRALVARDRAGRKWSVPLDAGHVATAQSALDSLDGQLATSVRRNWARSARIVAAVLAVALIGLADFGWVWIPLIVTLLVPSAWSLAAVGTLALGRAGLAVAGLMSGWVGAHSWVFATYAAACGIWACTLAWQWATSDDPHRARRLNLARLAVAGAVALIAVQGFNARAMRLAWRSGTPVSAGVVPVGALGYGVSLTPDGRRAAVKTMSSGANGREMYEAEHELVNWRHVIADSTGILRATDAYALAFADDENVLTVRALPSSTDSLLVSLERATDDSSLWQRTIPAFTAPEFALDRTAGRWTLFGHDAATGDVIIVAGFTVRDSVMVLRKPYDEIGNLPLHAFPDGSALVSRANSVGGPWIGLAVLGFGPMSWDLEHSAGGHRRPMGSVPGYPACGKRMDDRALHCTVHERARQSLWRIDAGSSVTPIGNLPREYDLWSEMDGTTIAGASRGTGEIALVDLATRTAVRVAADETLRQTRFVSAIATASGTTATLVSTGGTSELRFYTTR